MGKCIISKRLGENSGMGMSLFLSTIKDKKDFEIVAVFYAWLANGWDNENYVAQDYINKHILPSPQKFISEYNQDKNAVQTTFFRLLTNRHLDNLITRLKYIYKYNDSLEQCFINTLSSGRKSSYNHEVFAEMLSADTGFQTKKAHCSFYRYNLLYYWLTYKFNIWEMKRYGRALLPCNDLIFKNAFDKGVTKILLKTNLSNVKLLTQKAKDLYGTCNFYKMYENLNT